MIIALLPINSLNPIIGSETCPDMPEINRLLHLTYDRVPKNRAVQTMPNIPCRPIIRRSSMTCFLRNHSSKLILMPWSMQLRKLTTEPRIKDE